MSPNGFFSAVALVLAATLTECTPGADSSEPTGRGTGGEVTLKVDGPGIDHSRFQPALFPGLDWSCRWVSGHHQIFCHAHARAFEVIDPFTPTTECADGGTVYETNSRDLAAKRYYNSDYRLVRRVLHWYGNNAVYSRRPDGSGVHREGQGELLRDQRLLDSRQHG